MVNELTNQQERGLWPFSFSTDVCFKVKFCFGSKCFHYRLGDRGVTISRFPYPVLPPPVLFRPFVSWLPPFIVFLPLSCKSRCLTPYSNREGFCFVQNKKNCVVNRTSSHSPARSLKRHSFDTSLHHAAKSSVFCELQSYGASSQEGLPWTDFSPPNRKIPRPIKMVFDDILPDSRCCSYDETLTRLTCTVDTRVHVSFHLIHVLWCKRLGNVSNFTGSNAVFFFFYPDYEFSFFVFSRV